MNGAGRRIAASCHPPELNTAARPNHPGCATIAFGESDRPGRPRTGDAYGDIWITREPAPTVDLELGARSTPASAA